MHNLTKEQYNQLISILENFQNGNDEDNSGMKAGAVNFADPFTEEAFGNW